MSVVRLARRLVVVALLAALPVTEVQARSALRGVAAPDEPAGGEGDARDVEVEGTTAQAEPATEVAAQEPATEVAAQEPAASAAPVAPAPEGPIAADAGAGAPVSAPPAREPPKGLALTIAGAAVFGAIGVPLMFVGAWSTTVARSYGLHGTTGPALIVVGALGLGGGATLFGLGLARRHRWNKWRATQPPEVAVGVGRSPLGTMFPSLTMRF